MFEQEVKTLYNNILSDKNCSVNLKIQVLKNLQTYLQEEDTRMQQADRECEWWALPYWVNTANTLGAHNLFPDPSVDIHRDWLLVKKKKKTFTGKWVPKESTHAVEYWNSRLDGTTLMVGVGSSVQQQLPHESQCGVAVRVSE